jgi:ribosomal protein S18 acetylase RimI-like enzyme
MATVPAGLEFEAAKSSDSDLVSDLILGQPGQLTTDVGMRAFGMRDFGKARTMWRLMNRKEEAWTHVTLARSGEETVGVLMTAGLDINVSFSLLARALFLFGPVWLFRLPSRMKLQSRVHCDRPDGSFAISEMHVAASWRGRGIGGALLAEAERQAHEQGKTLMTLEVLTTNPAMRLYERAGFEVVQTSIDPEYERVTGCPGYHRMNRVLD